MHSEILFRLIEDAAIFGAVSPARPQVLSFGVLLFSDSLQLSVVFSDAPCERADRLEEGPEGRQESLGNVLGRLVMETHRRTLGQMGSKGFDRSLGAHFPANFREPCQREVRRRPLPRTPLNRG
jgi:hypothetical protein